jgi:hypothetical protein
MPAAGVADLPVIRLVNPATGAEFEFRGRWLRTGKATVNDVKRGLARFVGDKVFLNLPVGVKLQLDAGRLQIADKYMAREEIEALQTPQSMMPKGNASHDQWLQYAMSQGMPREEAVELTRDQIRARFTAPSFDPDAAPVMSDGPHETLND